MNKNRMTIEELQELQDAGKLPVTIVCDDKYFEDNLRVAVILGVDGEWVWLRDTHEKRHEVMAHTLELFHYPSLKQPKKMVKWYRVHSHKKKNSKPSCSTNLYTSEEHFLDAGATYLCNYHWIDLEFVCEKEEVEK